MDVTVLLGALAVVASGAGAWWAYRSTTTGKQEARRQTFVDQRALLNQNRAELSRRAAVLHASTGTVELVEGSPMLSLPGWAQMPVPLNDIRVIRDPDDASAPSPPSKLLPISPSGRRYGRYSSAMNDLARPQLFEDRLCYRLTGLQWSSDGIPTLSCSTCSYFQMIDSAEYLAHELANESRGRTDLQAQGRVTWRGLRARRPFRGDALSLDKRYAVPSIGTLLLRRDTAGEAAFLLHLRDPAAVAISGGHYSLIPAGVFQPSSLSPRAIRGDLSLIRSVVREMCEELLGTKEATGGSGAEIDYERDQPYASFMQAIQHGDLRLWALGVGMDPLTLTVELLSAAVVDAGAFDSLFENAVRRNDEGEVISAGRDGLTLRGFPFTQESVDQLCADGRLSPVAEACLRLAMKHRTHLLASR